MMPGMPPMQGAMQPQPGMPMQPGQQGAMYIQLVKQPDVMKYDIVVDESTQSRDVRERHFTALMQILPMAMQSGIPVPKEVIDYAPLPETLRAKWKEKLLEAENAPKQPPLALQIEQMRGENMKAIESMKAQAKQQSDQANAMLKQQQAQMDAQIQQQQIVMQAEAERVVQAAQAESQRMIDQSKLHMDAAMGMMDQRREQEKMMLDAKLSTFETLLNAMVDLQKSRLEAAQTPPDVSGQILPQVMKMLESQNAQMVDVMQVLSAPEELILDKGTGRPVGKRKVVKQTAKSGGDVQSQILDLLKVLTAPVELVHDPKTGRPTGTRRVLQ
jgi:hypothetical protein